MNALGIILVCAMALLTGYLAYTLIRDVRNKIRERRDKEK